jgi:hypothetical protein
LFLPLAWPLVAGRLFWEDDFGTFQIPLRYLYQQALLAGDSLLWTPAIMSGLYLHGEGQAGLFHPFHLFIYRVLPLTIALNLEFVTSYAAAFAGMAWFLKRLHFDEASAAFGAMLFAFGGFLVLHDKHLNLVAVAAHLPWLLGAVDVLGEAQAVRERAAAFTLVALLVASQILIGFPQAVWFNVIAAGAYALFVTLGRRRFGTLVVPAIAMMAGGMMGALQWLPTLETAAASIRPLLGPSFSATLSLHPANLLQLASPYLLALRVYNPVEHPFLHEYAVYTCAFGTIAPFWVALRWRTLGERRRLVAFAAATGLLALVLALGRYGGLNSVIAAVPGLRWTRGATRYLFLFDAAQLVIAAIAFEDLTRIAREAGSPPLRRRWLLWVPAVFSTAVTAAIELRLLPVFAGLLAPAATAAIGPALLIATTALIALAARGRRVAPALLVVLTALDLGRAGPYEIYRIPPTSLEALKADLPRLPAEPREGRLFVGTQFISSNLAVLNGFRLSSGYVALVPAMYLDPMSRLALRLSGTTWRRPAEGPLEPIAGAFPRARLLSNALYVPLGKPGDVRGAQLQRIAVDVERTAIVDRPVPSLASPPGRVEVVTDRPGHLVVRTAATGPQVLALTERFHDGWRAMADGAPLQTLRIHGDFLGSIVPAGDHVIEFRFQPRSFSQGLAVSAIGLLLCVVFVGIMIGWPRAYGRPRRRRRDTSAAARGSS